MSELFCNRCGKFKGLYGDHQCPPEWEVCDFDEYLNDSDPYWTTVSAGDAEEAAENWVQERESGDCEYPVLSGCNAEVVVRRSVSQIPVIISVSGEPVPTYYGEAKSLKDFQNELRYLVGTDRNFEAGRLYGQMHQIYECLWEPTSIEGTS